MIRHYPYIIGYSPTDLTNGQNYKAIPIRTKVADDFLMRAISGFPSVLGSTGTFRLIRPIDQPVQKRPQLRPVLSPLIPEAYFQGPDLGIQMDLNGVSKTVNSGSPEAPASQLAFHGVIIRESQQDYGEWQWRTADFIYQIPLTLSWKYTDGGNITPVRQFSLAINSYPFELCGIEIYDAVTGSPTVIDRFAIMFEDASNYILQSEPILVRNISRVGGWNVHYPAVPIVYPDNGLFTYYIQSLVPEDDGDTYTYQIVLRGKQRIKRWEGR